MIRVSFLVTRLKKSQATSLLVLRLHKPSLHMNSVDMISSYSHPFIAHTVILMTEINSSTVKTCCKNEHEKIIKKSLSLDPPRGAKWMGVGVPLTNPLGFKHHPLEGAGKSIFFGSELCDAKRIETSHGICQLLRFSHGHRIVVLEVQEAASM